MNDDQRRGKGDLINVYEVTGKEKMEEAYTFQANLLSSVNEAIHAADENCRITYWNEAAEKLYGWTAEEACGLFTKDLFKTIVPDSTREKMIQDNCWHGEVIQHHKDGLPINIEAHTKVLRDEKGGFKGTITSSRDITERKKVEVEREHLLEQLQIQSWQIEAVFSTIMDAVVAYDHKGRPIMANPAAIKIFGFNPLDNFKVVQKGRQSLRHLDGQLVIGKDLPLIRALAGQVIKDERYIYTNDEGLELIVNVSVAPLYMDGNVVGAVAICQDVSEKEKMAQSLKESKARLSAILEQLPVWVAVFDHDGKALLRNKQMNNYISDKIPSRDEQGMKQWHATDTKGRILPSDQWPGARALQGETVIPGNEFVYTGQSKHEYWILVSAAPLRSAEGEIIGGILVAKNITERKQAEAKIQQQKAILDGINRIFRETITCETEEELGMICLNVAQELTGSSLGFIGEINSAGYFDNIAVSAPGWATCKIPSGSAKLNRGLKIHGIYGRVLLDGKSLFANDPASHFDSIGLPDGHPLLKSFLGSPLIQKGEIIGMIGLGNKEGGYSSRHVETLEALTEAFVQVLQYKRVKRAQLESEQCLKAALEGAGAGMWVYNTRGKWVITSQLNVLFGRPADDPPLSLEEFFSLVHPEDLPQFRQAWSMAMEEGGVCEQEYRVPQPDGSMRWLFSKGRFSDKSGSLPHFIGITYDITKRKQAEQLLRENERRLEELVQERTRELAESNRQNREIAKELTEITDNMIDIIIKVDLDGNIQYLSPSYEKIMGYDIEDRLGKPALTNMHPDDIEPVTAVLKNSMSGETETEIMQFRCRRADGCYLWLEGTGKAVLDNSGAIKGAVFTLRDITERKLAEEKLRSSEERFYKIFHNSPDIVYIISMKDNKYIEINQKFTEIFGYTLEEVIGRTPEELNIAVDKNDYITSLYRELNEQGKLLNFEVEFRAKSGKIVDSLCSSEIINLNGEDCQLMVIKDVTKEKKLEAEMARLDRLNLIGEMAAGIGHEVRNPMTTVRGFLQLLGDKERYLQDRAYFDLMVSELDRANSIISEFLSLAKNKPVNFEKKDLNKILISLLPLIEADGLVADKYIKLKTNKVPDLLLDEKETRQMLLNLVRNGLEAMLPGGIITINTYVEEDEVVLSVTDNGKGIEPEVLEKLGTPFFTTKDHGTGLGLSVCYSIAARHKARIVVETGPEGTTFFVRYPMLDE